MKFKLLLLVAAAFTISVAANAQETNKDENGKRIYGPYETNAFGDNWFINANIGLNISMDGGFANLTRVGALNYGAGLTVDLAAGKWFTPCFGARLGWAGWGTGLSVPSCKPRRVETMSLAPSRASRSCSDSKLSSGVISVEAVSSISPVSSPASMSMVVTPLTLSPAIIQRCIGAAPRYIGSSDAWTFTQPYSGSSSTSFGSS